MRTYYVQFFYIVDGGYSESWEIRTTNIDMGTRSGVMDMIKDISAEREANIAIRFWKELTVDAPEKASWIRENWYFIPAIIGCLLLAGSGVLWLLGIVAG